jgi:hypothetical protein
LSGSVAAMDDAAPTLTELTVGDEPAAWTAVGFAVGDDGTSRVGAVSLRLVGRGHSRDDGDDEAGDHGILGWALTGAQTVEGLPTVAGDAAGPTSGPEARRGGSPGDGADRVDHPNGVTHLDHLVVMTPDLDRTTAALEAAGIAARRTREAGPGRLQRFFRVGEAILELVGPAEPRGAGAARFWGLAFTVADIDATAAQLAGRISEPKPAVQPGRRIATLRAGDAISVPVAFMSPDDAPRPRGVG